MVTKQEKLLALANRIDHEELWRRAGLDREGMTPEQKDRLDAGVALRRYADILAPGRWLVIPPVGSVQFSASTLDKAVEMAQPGRARCPNCDDTGDVHRADGEWMGRCTCPAGAADEAFDITVSTGQTCSVGTYVVDHQAAATTAGASVEPIPSGVYFSSAADNFYSTTGFGMGVPFYAKWAARYREFPGTIDAALAKLRTREVAPLVQVLAALEELSKGAETTNGKEWVNERAAIILDAIAQPTTPLDDGEVARLRRVVRALGMEKEVPDDAETLRGCLFSVLGQIAYKLESRSKD